MADIKSTLYHDLSAGNTINYGLQDGYQMILVYGTSTGAVSTNFTGTAANDMDLFMVWTGDSGGNAVTIAGFTMPTSLRSLKHLIHCHYDAVTTAWRVEYIASADTAFLIDAMISALAAIARAKIAAATANYVVINDAGGLLSEEQYLNQARGGFGANVSGFTGVLKVVAGTFSASALVNADISASAAIAVTKLAGGSAAQFLMSNGAGVPTWTTLSGITVDANGVVTFPSNQIQSFDVTIPTADVLTMFTTPISLVGAQGAGLGIELISAIGSFTYSGSAYATNGDIWIMSQTATRQQAANDGNSFLFGTVNKAIRFPVAGGSAAVTTQIIANQPLIAQVQTGNPTNAETGSDIRLQGLYRVISVP